MRKGFPFLLLSTLFLVIAVLFSLKLVNDKNVGKNPEPKEDFSPFLISEEETYVDDPILGKFPGNKKQNVVSSEYYELVSTSEGMLEVQRMYKFFVVRSIRDRDKSILELKSKEGTSPYTMECEREKTFAHHNENQVFISANFELMKAVSVGDMIATKCKDSICTTLGPECILIKN